MPQSNIYLNHNSPQLCETFTNYEIKQHIKADDETFKLFQQRYYREYWKCNLARNISLNKPEIKDITWKYEGNFVALLFRCSFLRCVAFRIKSET